MKRTSYLIEIGVKGSAAQVCLRTHNIRGPHLSAESYARAHFSFVKAGSLLRVLLFKAYT